MQKVYYRDWHSTRKVPFAFLVSRAAAPLSRALTALRVNPNNITLVAAVVGLQAIVAAFAGAWLLAGSALLAFLVLDHVDGQVARATDRRTRLGGYLDTLVDYSVDVLFLAAIAGWGILHDDKTALLALMALAAYCLQELLARHGAHTRILEALRSGDFRARNTAPTIGGTLPLVPHRDLNIIVLAVGLYAGRVELSLAALTLWWWSWAAYRVAKDVKPRSTEGLLIDLMHGDNH